MINADESIKRVLIVCPASLKINWQREAIKWLTRPLTVGVADGKCWPQTDVVVINYENVKKRPEIMETEWDLAVLDESHYIKNEKAQRTKATAAIKARRRIALTGTPILNRPIELFTTLNWLDPAEWGSFWTFARRYANAHAGRFGWDLTGASNLDELQKRLRTTCMVRRLKADVLTELPPKRRQVVELQAGRAALQAVLEERSRWEADESKLREIKAQAEQAKADGNDTAYKEAVKALSSARMAAFTELAELRHKVALKKVPAAVEFIRDALESSSKIVVFAHHLDVIEALREGLEEFRPVVVTGSVSLDERQRAVDAFQIDPEVRLFLGNIKAAGVGLTLTAASHVLFVELDWTPGWVSQAEDRCHRIGQRDSVLVQHLVLDGSLDANLAKMLVRKQEVSDKALNADETIFDE